MLEYGWGNPSSIMLSGEETPQDRPVFDLYSFSDAAATFANPDNNFGANHHPFQTPSPNTHFSSLYSASATSYPPPPSMLSLEPAAYSVVPKTEPMLTGFDFNTDYNSRIGLNLGGRTYFASSEDDFVNRLYRRSRIIEPGSVNSPRCQAEGCNADLTHAKHYHRRHKVCEYHSKAATVIAAGLTQRFCQQCSRS